MFALIFKALAEAGSMLGSGAIVVCDDTTCMLDMALNAVRFYRNESCGKCVPCRIGLAENGGHACAAGPKAASPSCSIVPTSGSLMNSSQAMSLTSICGLGQIVPAADSIRSETFSRRSGCARITR